MKPISVLTAEDVERLVGAGSSLTCVRDRALIYVLFHTALRVSEALSLRVQDLSPETGSLRVIEGKGGKGRTVALSSVAWGYVAAWLDQRRVGSEFVFCTHQGGRLNRRQVDAMLKRRALKAGLCVRVHAHALRHSFAATAVEKGVSVEFIRRQLGHVYLNTTQQYLRGIGEGTFVAAIGSMWDGK